MKLKNLSKIIFTFILILLLQFSIIVPIFANGGPAGSNGLAEGNNITFIQKKDISLDSENLYIDINPKEINVKVTYELTNHGKEDNMKYVFPVNLYSGERFFSDGGYLDNVKLYDGDKLLEYTVQSTVRDWEDAEDDSDFYEFLSGTKSFITDLVFKENEKKTLSVYYTVKGAYLNWGTSKRFLPSFGTNYFTYNLTPAANWGDGLVDHFKLIVDFQDYTSKDIPVSNIDLNLENYQEEEGIYTFEAENFDLTKQGKIKIAYDDSEYKLNNFLQGIRIDYSIIAKVTVSSELGERYQAANLFDNDFNTAWVEGVEGLGENEIIEIEFIDEVDIERLGFINGYTSDDYTYYNNGRVKKLKVELLSHNPVDDSNEVYDAVYEIEEKKYEDFNKNLLQSFMIELDERAWRIKKIRLTILDAYPGTKYEDTCISELYIFGWSEGNSETRPVYTIIPADKFPDITEKNEPTADDNTTSTETSSDLSNENPNEEDQANTTTTETNVESENEDEKTSQEVTASETESSSNIKNNQNKNNTVYIFTIITVIAIASALLYKKAGKNK